jgi:hypothetical protein
MGLPLPLQIHEGFQRHARGRRERIRGDVEGIMEKIRPIADMNELAAMVLSLTINLA